MLDQITRPARVIEQLKSTYKIPEVNGVVRLGDDALVRNSRGDAFYVVSEIGCTCPDFTFRKQSAGKTCKHIRKVFG